MVLIKRKSTKRKPSNKPIDMGTNDTKQEALNDMEPLPHTEEEASDRKMFFEHKVTPANESYEKIADRLTAAFSELNAALKEAHEDAQIRVMVRWPGGYPLQLQYQIYKLTHTTLDVEVHYKKATPEWQQVKDPDFRQAAGEGLWGKWGKKKDDLLKPQGKANHER